MRFVLGVFEKVLYTSRFITEQTFTGNARRGGRPETEQDARTRCAVGRQNECRATDVRRRPASGIPLGQRTASEAMNQTYLDTRTLAGPNRVTPFLWTTRLPLGGGPAISLLIRETPILAVGPVSVFPEITALAKVKP